MFPTISHRCPADAAHPSILLPSPPLGYIPSQLTVPSLITVLKCSSAPSALKTWIQTQDEAVTPPTEWVYSGTSSPPVLQGFNSGVQWEAPCLHHPGALFWAPAIHSPPSTPLHQKSKKELMSALRNL